MPEISPALYRAGEGEPLVLLHGFTGTWHHWRPVLADLVARFDVIAPTLSGHDGAGPFPDDLPMTLDGATDSLERHLDALGIQDAHFAGNSMGGALAIQLAKRGRARSVVALSPGGGWERDSGEHLRIAKFFARQAKALRAAQPHLERVMRGPRRRRLAMRDVMRYGERLTPLQAVELCRAADRCTVVDQVLSALRDNEVDSGGLESVSAPVLLAWSSHDRILPVQTCSSRYRRELRGAEFRVLPGVGHVPMWDAPHLVTETIADWATRHSAPTAAAAAT